MPTQSLFTRAVWLAFILVTLYVCYFSQLGVIGLIGPDEPRYAWIARDMAETGDFITPRLYGQPWFEKPPLYYWGAAICFKLFGVSEFAARLPSAIAAAMGTLALAWLAWRVYGSATARWLLLLLPTTVGMIGFSHSAATDMPFAGTLTCAMVAAGMLIGAAPFAPTAGSTATSLSPDHSMPLFSFRNRTTLLTAALFGFFIGRATLAKGPAALILCGGAAFFWALFTKRWRDTLRLLHPAGLIIFCSSALPWYVLCAYRNPDFFRVFIIEHNFKRFLTPEFQHIQPFWFYGQVLLLAFLPWTAALIWALLVGVRRLFQKAPLGPFTTFLLSWAGFCLVFFTISRSKLPGYILPAVPAIALLLVRSIAALGPARKWSFVASSLLASVFFAAGFFEILRRDDQILKKAAAYAPVIELLFAALAVANFLLALGFFFRRRNIAILAAVAPILAMFALLNDALLFTPVSAQSSRYLADQLRADRIPPSALRVSGIKRATLYGLDFYLHAELQEWNSVANREVWLLTTSHTSCANIPATLTCENVWERPAGSDSPQLLHLTPIH